MRLLLVLALLAPLTASAWPPGDTTGITLQFQNLTRSYNVHVPASYDGSVPVALVLDFHGYSNDAAQQESLSGFSALSDAMGFIVAYPQGYEGSGSARSWNAGVCCPPATTDGIDDVGFAKAVVADIESQANIDPLRVYATGLSNGGGMSQRIACDAADVFAAASPVACPLLLQPFALCQPARPISVLHFAGLTDQVIPYDGGPVGILPQFSTLMVPASPDSFAYWVGADGCGSGPPEVVEDFGDGASCETHTACANGAEVGLCSLYGTVFYGHVLYGNAENVNLAQRAWNFMSQFTLPPEFTTTTTSTVTTTSTTTTSTTLPSPNRCAGAKVKAAGKGAACLLGVDAIGAALGSTPDPSRTGTCQQKLAALFTKAEAKPPCLTSGDAGAIESTIGAFVGTLGSTLTPIPPAKSACGAAKLKAAGTKTKCLLTLQAKRVGKGIIPLPEKLQACRDKLTAAFAKAEGSADCVATGDAGQIEGTLDGTVTDLLCRLARICP